MGGHQGRPYSIFKMLLLLRKMDVIVDMVLTEAVVALAAGTVPELQFGMIRVRPAADRALVIIQPLLLLAADPLGFPAEVHRVFAASPGTQPPELPAAENEEVQHSYQRQHIQGERHGKQRHHKQRRIRKGQILDLDGDTEHQQKLGFREQHREGEEHGEVNICGGQGKIDPADKIHRKAIEHRQDHAGEKVNCELACAPVLLQRAADPIIKIEGDEGQHTRAGRVEHKGHQPPYLPVEDMRGREGQIVHQHRIDGPQYPEGHVADGDIQHQVPDAKVGVLIAKAFHIVHGVFHSIAPVAQVSVR